MNVAVLSGAEIVNGPGVGTKGNANFGPTGAGRTSGDAARFFALLGPALSEIAAGNASNAGKTLQGTPAGTGDVSHADDGNAQNLVFSSKMFAGFARGQQGAATPSMHGGDGAAGSTLSGPVALPSSPGRFVELRASQVNPTTASQPSEEFPHEVATGTTRNGKVGAKEHRMDVLTEKSRESVPVISTANVEPPSATSSAQATPVEIATLKPAQAGRLSAETGAGAGWNNLPSEHQSVVGADLASGKGIDVAQMPSVTDAKSANGATGKNLKEPEPHLSGSVSEASSQLHIRVEGTETADSNGDGTPSSTAHSTDSQALRQGSLELQHDGESDGATNRTVSIQNPVVDSSTVPGAAIGVPIQPVAETENSSAAGVRMTPSAVRSTSANRAVTGTAGKQSSSAISSSQADAVAMQPAGIRMIEGPGSSTNASVNRGAHSTSVGASSGEAFAALDAGAGAGKPTWIHAGSQSAEAGYEDPALGWVGVRADLSGSGVHAALIPGSAEAAQVLGGDLAGLKSHLSEQHAGVTSLTMDQGTQSGAGSSMGQSMTQNSGENAGHRGASDGQAGAPLDPFSHSERAVGAALAKSGSQQGILPFNDGRGGHISVMA